MIRDTADDGTVRAWLDQVETVGRIIRPSSRHYERCRRIYQSLTVDQVRACRDGPALARLERLLDRARHGAVPTGYALRRVWSRAHIGALLVEARNRLAAVQAGRMGPPRARGAPLDPARLPDAALDRLIQQHPDLDLVERLRAERARRARNGP